jgi:hypothetical protein
MLNFLRSVPPAPLRLQVGPKCRFLINLYIDAPANLKIVPVKSFLGTKMSKRMLHQRKNAQFLKLRASARRAATVSISDNLSSHRQLKSRPSASSGKPSDSIAPFTAHRITFWFLNNFHNIFKKN